MLLDEMERNSLDTIRALDAFAQEKPDVRMAHQESLDPPHGRNPIPKGILAGASCQAN